MQFLFACAVDNIKLNKGIVRMRHGVNCLIKKIDLCPKRGIVLELCYARTYKTGKIGL